MSLKGLLFIGLFIVCAAGALFNPYLGIYGYVADYCIGPSHQWWAAPFSRLGLRYSFTFALTTALGMLLNRHKLRFGENLLKGQEIWLLVFFAIVWLSVAMGGAPVGKYTTVDDPSVKFTKMLIVIFMMTHTITDIRKLNGLLWVFVLICLILGLQAYDLPRRAFVKGRLEGIGGADFAESNYFAAFLAAMLPIIGIQFIRCKKWYGKIVCAISAAFTANTVVLCRSRGALVGIAAGVFAALLLMPKKHRLKLIVCLAIAIIGGIRLSNSQFISRVDTITDTGAQRDMSAESRLILWQAGIQMLKDHPLGVGIGNLFQNIGWYVPQYKDMDVHNTYIRCADELGVQGTFVFAVIILTAYLQLLRTRKKTAGLPEKTVEDFVLLSFGLTISLTVMLVCGLTISMTYTEIIWILMTLPLCLTRTVENSMIDHALANAEACETSAATLSPAVGQGPMGPIPAVDMQTQDPEKSL